MIKALFGISKHKYIVKGDAQKKKKKIRTRRRKLYRNGEGELYFFLAIQSTMCDNCDKLGGCALGYFYFFLIDAICIKTSYEC